MWSKLSEWRDCSLNGRRTWNDELCGSVFELEQWFQPFGREATFLEHLRSLAEPWVDECWIDDYGSLIAHQRGDGKCVMVTAQADVQTVVITYIHEDGTARFLMTGKGSYHVTRGNAVRFAKQLVGVVEYDDDCKVHRIGNECVFVRKTESYPLEIEAY